MSDGARLDQSDPLLCKLRKAKRILNEAEEYLCRAEAAARPIYYLDLHAAQAKALHREKVLPLAG